LRDRVLRLAPGFLGAQLRLAGSSLGGLLALDGGLLARAGLLAGL
jgi:hypothetical protein